MILRLEYVVLEYIPYAYNFRNSVATLIRGQEDKTGFFNIIKDAHQEGIL